MLEQAPDFAADLLRGADEIATFLYGDAGMRRKVYHLTATPLADVILGNIYFAGQGVPRNYTESVKWLKLAIANKQEPARSIAIETLDQMSKTMQNAAGDDKVAGFAAMLAPYAAMLPHRRGGQSAATESGGNDYFGHKVFNDVTGHELDPFEGPGD